jgi:hypothetical protein
LKFVYMVDPNNSFYLQTIANNAGEFILISMFVLMILLPALALFMMLMGMAAALFIKLLAKVLDKKHECPACLEKGVKTKVCDSASVCPKCGAPQPNIRKVGLFGFPSSKKLGNTPPQKHALKLLSARRCRWCATPLATGKALCGECGRPQWDEELFKAYLKKTNIWFYVLTGLGLVVSLVPGISFLVMILLIFYSLFAIRPLDIHMRRGSRFLVSLLMNMVKILRIILFLVLSWIPGASFIVLVPSIVKYLLIRKAFVRQFRPAPASGPASPAPTAQPAPAEQTPAAPEKPEEQTPAASLPAPEPAAETAEPAPEVDAEKAEPTAPEDGGVEIAVPGDAESGKDAPAAK